ncbi:hypothetical protein VC83_03153 [Pseudogymnoascus destructans]|uniref:TOM core complex subunit Tom6 n=2 Tax=Pseudogymnoascus destructans TaxID=655981 RepID=L8G955_PSED2|nr:uncharacterized protein VC83_03153 [Pseudogymnoascus destructans]ELR09414.1 hypothetical protein GMDG_03978 [Pseudogymnoascus destructans 20631-21]OAF60127.1 hypothetical protein VC83_03153 [Pseudogymnoascus destructans]
MPPKTQRVVVERAGGGRRLGAQRGYLGQAYEAVTSSENASVVRSITVFAVAVAFFSSQWSDLLLPAL